MAAEKQQEKLRVVEFYSGIGGMHYALKACGISFRVVAAIDINTTANQVYSHNFPDTVLLNRNIEGIKLDHFIKLDADVFLMSPPCQPFTRQGNQKASNDARTKSFLHIMKILTRLPKAPSYILMENVKGFEISDTREEFIKTLEEANYVYQEFLLTPTQFGIPNSRLRYFLIAVQKPMKFPFEPTKIIMLSLPDSPNPGDYNGKSHSISKIDNPRDCCMICSKMKNNQKPQMISEQPRTDSSPTKIPTTDMDSTCCNEVHHLDDILQNKIIKYNQTVRLMRDFLELDDENNYKEFLLSETILKSKVLLMDIVQEGCNHSCCFTKGYGHYVEGTGSVLQMKSADTSLVFCQYTEASEEERLHLLAHLGLRYFTPREISNIHCFPKVFDFPQITSTKQKYRLLGNSLNVLVLSQLMKLLFA